MHNVVIVESPAKAKTINKYLGSDYEVLASYGHVRDLPAKDGSVDPEADFHMLWEVDGKSAQRLNEIARAVKGADKLILATDPDREGEAISWHVLEVLRAKKALKDQPVERVVFNAITKQAILDAMKHPREIDSALVDAYLARRALDYLVGFNLSPVLWRKLPGARSAGRVQSVALRLVCDREVEIERFKPREYWSLVAQLKTPRGEAFEARISSADGKRLGRLDVPDEATATALKQAIEASELAVANVEAKPGRRNPQPPFTTSTLQQEASRKLGFAPNRTMQLAQRLYEGVDIGGETVGLITYMRTDGVDMAPEAVTAVRSLIGSDYGDRYLPSSPRRYTTKAKNAQEAHEAVRPTDPRRTPKEMARRLDDDQAKLYELIWKRTVASQMESAEVERTTVDISANGSDRRIELRATGTVVTFDGFLALYQEGRDDEEDDEARRLPQMSAGEPLDRVAPVAATQHFTEPPPRYTEAALVKRMEELGIGRPSTYAATLTVLRDRGYVQLDKKRLVPDDKGRLVTAFLESFFNRYVEYDFTAGLEEQLDRVSNDELDWKEVLRDFWREFTGAIDATKELRVTEVLNALNEVLGPYIFPARADGGDPRVCPTCGTGQLSLKLGKFGSFVGCSNYPECRYTRPLGAELDGTDGAAAGADGVKALGTDPASGQEVTLRNGRFGPYVQLGEPVEKEKPKRASLPKGWSAAELDLEGALKLLSLPRLVGVHPESGKPIEANLGRYGPYVSHDGVYANLDGVDEVFSVGINRAVAALAEKKEKRGARGAVAGRALGEHPGGGPITVHAGRYGPYVKYGKVNATLPQGTDPEALTLEEAVRLVDAKAEKGGGRKPARKPAAKKAAAKKPAAKKAASGKTGKAAKAATG
ncbi:type I DNA topoisomerase [Hansschlegelia beijingensis]|uniref:DNA topoisomerase 1 n=1 Tax=Hansschlegelia beijingensis TaxID=1133344 RepID=A0A7W6CXW7_9HYPH|nr:type I DNA topoisomerase [Hansschlegelia beijingensis]MBB3972277.1 DNA topoisomerase-1 [Hansschlegelia beijingensis]